MLYWAETVNICYAIFLLGQQRDRAYIFLDHRGVMPRDLFTRC